MKVGTQFSIAVHAMLMVAYFPEVKITSEVVAQSVGCNPVIIRNAFAKLKRANLLLTKSWKGKTELARSADEISLWDIYSAIEGPDAEFIFKIHTGTSGICPVGSQICDILREHLTTAANAMKNELSAIKLSDLKNELNHKKPEK